MNNVTAAITAIRLKKQAGGIFPTHATIKELMEEGCTMPEIREAVASGLVEYRETLNGHYFTNK
jgi:hypothetical protein